MGRKRAIALVTLALLALGVAAGLVALSSPRLTTRLARDMVTQLARQLPGVVAFEHLQVLPLEARISIHGLRVAARERPAEPALVARRVDLTLDRLALLRGKVRLAVVDVEAPVLRGRHLGGGRYDWASLLPPSDGPSGPSPVTVAEVRWRAGQVSYEDGPQALGVALRGLEGEVRLAPDMTPTSGRLAVAGGALRRGGVPWELLGAETTLGRRGQRLRLTHLRVAAAGATLSGQGELRLVGPDAPLVAQGGLAVSLGQLPAWPELAAWRPSGAVSGDWTIGGTGRDPSLALRLQGRALRLRQAIFPELVADVAVTGDQLTVGRARLSVGGGGRLEASGRLPLAAGGEVDFRGSVAGLEVTRLATQLGLEVPAGLAARVTASARATGRGLEPRRWDVAGEVFSAGSAVLAAGPEPYVVRSSFGWQRETLTLTGAEVSLLGGRLSGRGEVQLPAGAPPRLALAGSLEGLDVARAARAGGQEVYATGRLGGTYALAGVGLEPLAWQGTGVAQFSGAVPADVAVSNADVPLACEGPWRLAGARLSLDGLAGRVLGGRVAVRGTVPLTAPATGTRLSLVATGIDVRTAGRLYDAPDGLPPARASARLRVEGLRTFIDAVEAPMWGGRITASGRAEVEDAAVYGLEVRAAGLALDGLRRSFAPGVAPLAGRAGARLAVRGRGSRWSVDGHVEAVGEARLPEVGLAGAFRRVPVRLNGVVRLTPGGLTTGGLRLTLADARATVRGTLDRRGRSDLALDGRVPSPERLGALLGVAGLHGEDVHWQARARGPAGDLRLEGDLGAAELGRGDVALTRVVGQLRGRWGSRLLLAGSLAGEATRAGRPLSAGWRLPLRYEAPAERPARGRLTLAGLEARLGEGRVQGDAGWDGQRREVRAHLWTERLKVGDLLPDAPASGTAVPPGTSLAASLDLEGPVTAPRGLLQAQLGAFRQGGEAFGASELRARSEGHEVRLDGRLFGGAATLVGRVPLADTPGQLTLLLRRVRLDPLLAAVPDSLRGAVEWPLGGELAGRVDVSGRWRRPREARATAELQRLLLRYPELEVANEGPWRISYARDRVLLDAFHLVGGGTNLTAHGTLGLGGPSNVTVDGRLDLALLEKIAPRQFAGASGRARLEGSLRGRLGAEDFTGALTLRDGELETRGLPQPIHDLSAAVRLTHDRVFLDQLRAGFGPSGRLEAAGGARLGPGGDLAGINVKLDAQEVALRFPGIEAVTNADLSWAWTPGQGRLDGQVRILEGLYSQDVALTPGALRSKPRPSQALQSPFVQDTALRLQALLPDGFLVRNNVARGEVRGDVLVLGTAADPILVGRAEALDTVLSFQGQEFQVQEATVDFIDPRVLTPYLHLAAHGKIEGVEVTVRANGTPDKLRLDLSSTPAMSQTDILTLIATGKTGKELGEAAGGGLGAASNVLLDRVADGVARGITEQGVVDVLKVKPGSVDPATPGGGSFTVGKRVNEQLTITYTQDITAAPGRPQGRVMIFDYLLTDAVVLKLEQDLGGGFNASARYRLPVR
ncbi:MAG: translocation/assembly module TamB domain-containing protein [Candidatus Sericytochromatia bacterium]|nr:translocation/assembly module TamB domain-containing protein [Candidatus Sericytochromatia bacterium]